MKSDNLFKGEIFGPAFSETWITPYLMVHFLSGFVLYYIGFQLFRDRNRAVVFAVLLHLFYEMKDFAAFYEEPWAVKFNDWEYNQFLALVTSRKKTISSVNNVPINSLFDQILSMIGIYLAYMHISPNNHKFYISVLLFVISLTFVIYLEFVYRD